MTKSVVIRKNPGKLEFATYRTFRLRSKAEKVRIDSQILEFPASRMAFSRLEAG